MQWENHVIYRDNYVRGMIKNRPRAFLLRLSEAELTLCLFVSAPGNMSSVLAVR